MGNVKSKKSQKEMDKFFEREKWKEQQREEKIKIKANPLNKRTAVVDGPMKSTVPSSTPPPVSAVLPPTNVRTYDDEALDLMRYQLHYDADAFLLNNILLSVQFFENYESELDHIKTNPIGEREQMVNDAMVQHHKHVFFADRIQERVNEHVCYGRTRTETESLVTPRLFIIYDNVEASEPGDTSDYSTVLDAPFYKLCIKDTKEPGYVKLQKLEILKSTLTKQPENIDSQKIESDDSVYTDSEKESIESDDDVTMTGGDLLEKIKNRLNGTNSKETFLDSTLNINKDPVEYLGRRASGPTKQISLQVQKSTISNINKFQNMNIGIPEDNNDRNTSLDKKEELDNIEKPRKSILKKYPRRLSGPVKDSKSNVFTVDVIAEDTETSGYRSNSTTTTTSSRQNDLSESESDYGYATITKSTTPKKIELSFHSNSALTSGVLPDESWIPVEVEVDGWSDDEEVKDGRVALSKTTEHRRLYETQHYLNSIGFMRNFVDIFITNLGASLGLTQEAINNALTQGASVYCDTLRNGNKMRWEIFPALVAAWPNSASQFIIRERKIIQNPRTNLSYQWPTKQMVNKTIEFGCFLVPVGFRPKRGLNPEQKMQWRVIFPTAERYLEKSLAHSHIRCYLFAIVLHKAFMENDTSKIGVDANHIKNHLFWQCESNFAKWPEDRLGESLRSFLQTFYLHFGHNRLPNYFMSTCNEFKSVPKPLLLKLQRKLADILEAPVTHILHSLSKLKYIKKDFYPKFNAHRLYKILTCKNPLRLVNPSIPATVQSYSDTSDSEDEHRMNFWEKVKNQDKQYRRKKEKHRRQEARRKAQYGKQKTAEKIVNEMNPNVKLPTKLDGERRRLVLEFFIPHFIAMARSSEKFEAIGQAIIYLEQAQRLCMLLLDEPIAIITANEYLDVIRDKLPDCQRKLANQDGYKLPPRRESNFERPLRKAFRKNRRLLDNKPTNLTPSDSPGISAFTFVDVHVEEQEKRKRHGTITLNDPLLVEESRL